ncbi:hypothetical protein [Methylomonas sp. YC3]
MSLLALSVRIALGVEAMNQNHPYKIALLIFLTGFLSAVSAAPGGGGRQGGGNQGRVWQTHPDPRRENQQQQMQERNREMQQERNQQDGSWQLQEREREREQHQLREHQLQN